MLAGLIESLYNVIIRPVAEEIHKEVILPLAFFARPGFYIRQIYLVLFENIQHVCKGTCLMCGAEKYRCFVFARTPAVFFADCQKAGNIICYVLDILADDFQAVQLGGDC